MKKDDLLALGVFTLIIIIGVPLLGSSIDKEIKTQDKIIKHYK